MRAPFCFLAAMLVACGASAPEDDAEASAQEITSRGRRVCSWNIRRLGHDFDGRPKDLEVTAKIIKGFCDVIAVQEVMQTSGGETPGHDQLLAELGHTWGTVVTEQPRPDAPSANSERYAFYFRKSVASLCDGWQGTRYFDDAEDAFLREPAWACLQMRDHSGELVLASYHAIYGSPIERRREVSWLGSDLDGDGKKDDVLRAIRRSRPGAAVAFVGDFNLTPGELADALPGYVDLTAGDGSTLNLDDGITDNLYDHLVVAPDDVPRLGASPAEVLDLRARATGDSFFRSVSDHLPIRFVLGSD